MSVRINARLDSEHSRKLAYLQARTGKSATEIVHASLELYFEHVAGPVGSQALLEGFVGSADADEDLSTEYKAHLTTSLEAKAASEPKRTRRK
jgi:hypothetical protein